MTNVLVARAIQTGGLGGFVKHVDADTSGLFTICKKRTNNGDLRFPL